MAGSVKQASGGYLIRGYSHKHGADIMLTSCILLIHPKRPKGHAEEFNPPFARGKLCPNRAEAEDHTMWLIGSQYIIETY